MSARKLLWPVMVLALTSGAIWQADRAGWSVSTKTLDSDPPSIAHRDEVRRQGRVIAEGRLVTYPGAEVVVGIELGGTIVDLPVQEKTTLHKGDLIAELKSDDLRTLRAEACARIAEAEADIRFFEREVQRMEQLHARNAGSQSDVDGNRRNLEVARARRNAAIATRDHFDVLIAKTRITSPIDGVVLARHAHPGETVEAGMRLVTVADLSRVRIEAEVDEFDVDRIVLGAGVEVTAEGYRDVAWRGTVEEIPDTVVGRRIRPEDPGRPTDTRVLLVKIALDEPSSLKLGQRVEVIIYHY